MVVFPVPSEQMTMFLKSIQPSRWGNTGSGISLMDTSLVHKNRSLADIHITNNGAWGLVCSVPPAVAQIVGFTFQTGDISGNASGNINCPISPGPLAQ